MVSDQTKNAVANILAGVAPTDYAAAAKAAVALAELRDAAGKGTGDAEYVQSALVKLKRAAIGRA
jgi:hypothetical protein